MIYNFVTNIFVKQTMFRNGGVSDAKASYCSTTDCL
nr:MAG TPA: hypothetical protein [Caudoviricetes sp.]